MGQLLYREGFGYNDSMLHVSIRLTHVIVSKGIQLPSTVNRPSRTCMDSLESAVLADGIIRGTEIPREVDCMASSILRLRRAPTRATMK